MATSVSIKVMTLRRFYALVSSSSASPLVAAEAWRKRKQGGAAANCPLLLHNLEIGQQESLLQRQKDEVLPQLLIRYNTATQKNLSSDMNRTAMHEKSPKFFSTHLTHQACPAMNLILARSPWKSECRDVKFNALEHAVRDKMPDVALQLFLEMKSEGFLPDCATLSALMLCFAGNGFFVEAQALWIEIISSSSMPSVEVVSDLMNAYARMGQYDEVRKVVNETISRNHSFPPKIYSLAVSCFGKAGQLEMMEDTVKEMVSRGFRVDSLTGNAFVIYYSAFGSLSEMEAAYGRLKRSRILIEQEAIRAVAAAYISERKFYNLGEFLRDVGLGRRNTGNLLWNLFLLSFAANFKMKSLQREFLMMLEAGFSPDLTTFNIRALAFSRMQMFWDLHLSLEHMRHERVDPDLVTYGCIVDAYLDRRLGRNLSFALENMNVESTPVVATDPLVFEVFGKGDFHSSTEALLEFKSPRKWTYSKSLSVYLKKQYRSNQIFWNY